MQGFTVIFKRCIYSKKRRYLHNYLFDIRVHVPHSEVACCGVWAPFPVFFCLIYNKLLYTVMSNLHRTYRKDEKHLEELFNHLVAGNTIANYEKREELKKIIEENWKKLNEQRKEFSDAIGKRIPRT